MSKLQSKTLVSRAIASLVLMLTAGCAIGQRLDYTRAAPTLHLAATGSAAVGAHDQRPYVLSGNKTGQFIGLLRSGFGIPYDVVTASGQPFSNDVADVMARALSKGGGSVATFTFNPRTTRENIRDKIRETAADRAIVLTINEWKTDGGPVTTAHFDLKLEEFDRGARLLRASEVRGTDQISGYYWSLNPHAIIDKGAAEILQRQLEKLSAALAPIGTTPTDRLRALQQLLDERLISQPEYDQKRKEVLDGV